MRAHVAALVLGCAASSLCRRVVTSSVNGVKLPVSSPGGGRARAAQPRFNVLPSVIGDSGGPQYTVQVEPHAPRTASAFLDDLRAQYLLGYMPSRPPDGKYRRVKVETIDKRLQVRHRAGYLAVPAGR